MAELTVLGEYQNETEKWAAEYLRDILPDDYRIYAALCLVCDRRVYEVDIVVAGGYAIHLIDVKGFTGQVEVGQGAWKVNGRYLDGDPHYKIQQHARHFPITWSATFRQSERPWFQGSVFVAGTHGDDVRLVRHGQQLHIWNHAEIVDYLQTPRHEEERNRMTPERIRQLEEVLACTHKMRYRRSLDLHGFVLATADFTSDQARFTVRSEYQFSSMREQYDLDVINLQGLESESARRTARRRHQQIYEHLSRLHGTPGIPRVLPPFLCQDGAFSVLPVAYSPGTSLAGFEWQDEDGDDAKADVLRRLVAALSACHDRGVFLGGFSAADVLVRDIGDVRLQSVLSCEEPFDEEKRQTDLRSLLDVALGLFTPEDDTEWSTSVTAAFPDFAEWAAGVRQGEIDSLDPLLEVARDVRLMEDIADWDAEPGAVVHDTYRLLSVIGKGASGEVWESEHLHGDFRCAVKIFEIDPENEMIARQEFERLVSLSHPNIVRLYSFGRIPGQSRFYLVNELGESTLRDLIQGTPEAGESSPPVQEVLSWFTGCIQALEYMRRQTPPIVHRDIKPSNITVVGDRAMMIDFGISTHPNPLLGTLPYMMPGVVDGEIRSSPDSDLYALCLSFYELLTGRHPFDYAEPTWDAQLSDPLPGGIPARIWSQIKAVLLGTFPAADEKLSEFLKISRWNHTVQRPLPVEFCRKWDINPRSKIEPYLVAVLLQHGGEWTKNQVITGVLSWKRESSGHRNSYAAALATLRSRGVLDYPEGKQPKGKHVKVTLLPKLVADWKARYG